MEERIHAFVASLLVLLMSGFVSGQHYEDWSGMQEKLAKDSVELLIYFNPQFT